MDSIRLSTAFVIAYATCSTVIFLQSLTVFDNVWSPVFGLAVGLLVFVRVYKSFPKQSLPLSLYFYLLIGLVAVFYLPLVFLPHTGEDDLIYHLTFLEAILKNSALVHDPLMLNFDLSKLFEFPLLILQFNRFQFSKFVNVFASTLIALVIYQSTRARLSELLAFCLSAAFLSFEVVYNLANSCYVELFLTLCVGLCWLFYSNYLKEGDEYYLWYSCVLMAISIATKISALLFFVPFLTYHYFYSRNLTRTLLVCGVCLSFALPWMIRNALIHHNPFFPLGGEIFPSPFISLDRYVFYNVIFDMFNSSESYFNLLFLPFNILTAGFNDNTLLVGFYSVAGIVAYVGYLQSKDRFTFVFVTPFILAWLLRTHQNRFLLPIFVIGLLCLIRKNILVVTALLLGILQGLYSIYDSDKLEYYLGRLSDMEYIERKRPTAIMQKKLLDKLEIEDKISPNENDRIYTVGYFYRGFIVSQPVTTNLYYEFEPIINQFSKNSDQNLSEFWAKNRIKYLYIFNNYDEIVLPESPGFDFEAYKSYRDQNWILIYRDNLHRIYQVR